MGASSLQIDPKPFKKVELALFCLYLKELVGKCKKIQTFKLSTKVGGRGTPAEIIDFTPTQKLQKIEDLTWCIKLMILTRRSSQLPLDVFCKLTLFS